MFSVTDREIAVVLQRFGIQENLAGWKEIQRHAYEKADPQTKEVRLILKVDLADGSSFILKFLREDEHPREQVEEQSAFSELLRTNGIPCAKKYATKESGGNYTCLVTVGDNTVYATMEEFESGELKAVTVDHALEIGELQARAHNISEQKKCHVRGSTLFNPFEKNDLTFYGEFEKIAEKIPASLSDDVSEIKLLYKEHMRALEPVRHMPRYAVQGDISNNNLYRTEDGLLGMFDFNNCADNYLLCDAVLQGVYFARLMDYEEELTRELSRQIFHNYFVGYHQVRAVTDEEQKWIPHLLAITNGFWGTDIKWGDTSLNVMCRDYEREPNSERFNEIEAKLSKIQSILKMYTGKVKI